MIPGFGELGERLRRSTVHVGAGAEGSGSGVIWDASGLVITNAHVARRPQVELSLWDGRRYPGRVDWRDDARDLAAVRFQAPGLTVAAIGDSSKVAPGELVVAVGNPLGFVGALTTGIVHAVGPVGGMTRREYIQANVRLAPGNSGGPLADALGRVIGINTMVVLHGGVPGGLGLAIPSNAVRRFLARRGTRPTVGVSVRPVRVRFRRREAPGLVVVDIGRGSPAERASLMVGDILVAAGGKTFETMDDLSVAVENASGPLRIQFLRGDRTVLRETTVFLEKEAAAA
jgi:serine protease Do